jgi:uncharacterized protein (DUF2147 family)
MSAGAARSFAAAAVLLTAAVLLVALVAASGGGAASDDPLVGYWVGGDHSHLTLIDIQNDGDSYKVLANPNVSVGDAKKNGDKLVVDTHAVVMTFSPAGADKLSLEFSGEMFKQTKTVTLNRVDETQYADAATAYGLSAIGRGLAMWKAGGGKAYPPPKEVTPTGMLGKMIGWPTNLFTAKPMQPGEDKGDYTYKQLDGGKAYSLIGHLSDGTTVGK